MSDPDPSSQKARLGLIYAGGAFFIWGLVPIYFHAVRAVPALEIIAHRVLWSMLFLALVLAFTRGLGELSAAFRRRRLLALLACSSTLIAINWLTFVWAMNNGRLLDASLGYFVTPQVNVLLGFVFLGERLRRVQWLALLLAAAGVLNQVVLAGQLPWIALVLALSFGSYGLLRKQARVDPVTGLLVETMLIAPVAIGYLLHLARTGALRFGHVTHSLDALLVLLGVVTAIPLMMFAAGAQRLRLVTIGFLQYLAPSMAFLLATFVYGEKLGFSRALTFVLIWVAVALYAVDSVGGGVGKDRRPA